MYGLGGQLCIACPEQQTLLTTIADTRLDPCGVQKIYDAFFEEVLPYTESEDMAPEMFSLKVRTLADKQKSRIASAGPYSFAPGNPLRLTALSLEENRLVMERSGSAAVIPFRPGDYLETAWPGQPDVPAVVTSGWTEPGQLRLRCHAAGTSPCGFEMLVCFRGSSVTVQSFRSWDPLTEGYDGVVSGTLISDMNGGNEL